MHIPSAHGRNRSQLRVALIAAGFAAAAVTSQPSIAGTKVLYSFCGQAGCADGSHPQAVIEDASGNLYGVAGAGGNQDDGVAYELTATQTRGVYAYSEIYSFCSEASCTDGWWPRGSLIVDTSGNLYGVTEQGGGNGTGCGGTGCGVVYELSPAGKSWTYKVLYNFCSLADCADGSLPVAGLTYSGAASGSLYDGTSPLYGTTIDGGDAGHGPNGVVYQLQPAQGGGWNEQVIYSFCHSVNCPDGYDPVAPVTMDALGNLYGTTAGGGNISNNGGTLFELSPSNGGWTETVLYEFCSQLNLQMICTDGLGPERGVTMDADGNLLGTTPFGGRGSANCGDEGDTFGCGLLYKVTPNGTASQETVLHEFCSLRQCSDGYNPTSGVVIDAKGNIIGSTDSGGNANQGGVLFRFSGSTYSVIHDFCGETNCTDGAVPDSLFLDQGGRLFGTTAFGGANPTGCGGSAGCGTAFQYAPVGIVSVH
jgi:uncharacterized repeat protein (TIGR03803 family)